MAKQIKVIKCPHCGSTHNALIKEDHYRCENCNTEYFLDNDDVNININHQQIPTNTNTQHKPVQASSSTMPIWAIALILLVCFGIIGIIKSQKSDSSPSPSLSTATKKLKERIQLCDLFVDQTTKDITITKLVYRTYDDAYKMDKRNSYFISFTNLLTGKVIKEQKLDMPTATPGYSLSKEWSFRTFEDGMIYVINNEQTVYLINIQQHTIKNVTASLFSKSKELLSGIATVTFVYPENGSGFSILTNDGQKVVYYPLINKLYKTDDDYDIAREHFETIPQGQGVNKLQFAFYNPDNFEKNAPIELVKIKYTDYPNGPKRLITEVFWSQGYNQKTGQYIDAKSKYRVIQKSDVYRVIDFKVLAAGRLFFYPSVFYSDQNNLFIKAQVNAAPNAPYNLQKLDINTGAVLWTLPNAQDVKAIRPYGDDQFILQNNCHQYTILDAVTGDTVKTLILK